MNGPLAAIIQAIGGGVFPAKNCLAPAVPGISCGLDCFPYPQLPCPQHSAVSEQTLAYHFGWRMEGLYQTIGNSCKAEATWSWKQHGAVESSGPCQPVQQAHLCLVSRVPASLSYPSRGLRGSPLSPGTEVRGSHWRNVSVSLG